MPVPIRYSEASEANRGPPTSEEAAWYNESMDGNYLHGEVLAPIPNGFETVSENLEDFEDCIDYLAECLWNSMRPLGQPIGDGGEEKLTLCPRSHRNI